MGHIRDYVNGRGKPVYNQGSGKSGVVENAWIGIDGQNLVCVYIPSEAIRFVAHIDHWQFKKPPVAVPYDKAS